MIFADFRDDTTDRYVYEELWSGADPYKIRQLINVKRVIDIGANIGMFALLAAALFPDAIIDAYEPEPGNYAQLCENITLNGLGERVTAHPVAVWADANGTTISSAGGCSQSGLGGTPCPTVALDDVIGDEPVDILKVDTEGAEFWFFPPSTRLHLVRFLTMEFHDYHGPEAREALLAQFNLTHDITCDLIPSTGGMLQGRRR